MNGMIGYPAKILKRVRLILLGQVQGVGFRPFIYQLAHQYQLTGFVKNHPQGVYIEVQGDKVDDFVGQLSIQSPPLARIDELHSLEIPVDANASLFKIGETEMGLAQTIVPPDLAICDLCLAELFDPLSRFYRYPFLNCTQCGPRFSLIKTLPYDRANTAMSLFPLCAQCHEDYHHPMNRRYHAQPTACPVCGPTYEIPVESMSQQIKQGEIIAIKGLGGYQYFCDAYQDNAVKSLRDKKSREEKPFAVMVLNLESAALFAEISQAEAKLLISRARPIVLLRQKQNALSPRIAPNLTTLGLMLPTTPLHYLLFHIAAGMPRGSIWLNTPLNTAFVVTSANHSGEPIPVQMEHAIGYNRKITARVDDSVVQVISHRPQFIRRARGYVPSRITLPCVSPSVLALGAHLKNTMCLTRRNEAFVSQHIGSLDNKKTIEFFHETLDFHLRLLSITPKIIAHDAHPDFYTTQLAQQFDLPSIAVQHHHAHVASVMAEHHLTQPVLGVVLDGYGYGENGEAWGGELLWVHNTEMKRVAHLYPLPHPGGDLAAREPWRMGAAVLYQLNKHEKIAQFFDDEPQANLLADYLKNAQIPMTTSAGRLFDAAAALLKMRKIARFEGQTGLELENLVSFTEVLTGGWQITDRGLSFLPLLDYLTTVSDRVQGSNIFHGTLIAGLSEWIKNASEAVGVNMIVLSGGCFLNRVLTQGLTEQLQSQRLSVFLSQQLPPNDGNISLGQAWIARNALCV